jgi:hypothetical protein
MKMDAISLGERLKTVIRLLEEVGADMNDRTRVCDCCGLAVRQNMDDYQAKQAVDAAASRIVKLYDKLYEGEWAGREIAPVVSAQRKRGDR